MEAQESPRTEQTAQAPMKRELALVSRSTYLKEKALQWIFFACAFLAVVTVILIFVFTRTRPYPSLPILAWQTSLALHGHLPRATTALCRCLPARVW